MKKGQVCNLTYCNLNEDWEDTYIVDILVCNLTYCNLNLSIRYFKFCGK